VKRKKRTRKRQNARRDDNKDWKGGMTKGKGRNKGIEGRNIERRKEEERRYRYIRREGRGRK
jgi:hypothetical protein